MDVFLQWNMTFVHTLGYVHCTWDALSCHPALPAPVDALLFLPVISALGTPLYFIGGNVSLNLQLIH